MGRAQTRCGAISYSEQGTGFPLVLLHASLCDRRGFAPIIPALAERHRVIAVDWPWHGESDSPPPPLTAGAGLFAGVLEDFTQAAGARDRRVHRELGRGFRRCAARHHLPRARHLAGSGQQRRLHPDESAHPRLLHPDGHPCAVPCPAAPFIRLTMSPPAATTAKSSGASRPRARPTACEPGRHCGRASPGQSTTCAPVRRSCAPTLIIWEPRTSAGRHAHGAPLTPRSQAPGCSSWTPATCRSPRTPGPSCRWFCHSLNESNRHET